MCLLFWKKKRKQESMIIPSKPVRVEDRITLMKSDFDVIKPVLSFDAIERESEFDVIKPEQDSDAIEPELDSDAIEPELDIDVIEPTPDNEVAKEKKVLIQKYHVSQNKDKDALYYLKWRVRKEGSEKTIQFFDTQKEAIDFAQDLALKAGSTVVIHKVDGSIRKQDYTK